MEHKGCNILFTAMVVFIGTAVAGCSVGPDFEKPKAPNVSSYDAGGMPEKTLAAEADGGQEQKFVQGKDIPADWWKIFRSEDLNKLIEQSLKSNPSLQAAQAALESAEENLYAGRGSFLPSVSAGGSAVRQKTSGSTFGALNPDGFIFNLFNASVGVAYNFDLFGGTRRAVEALSANVDYERFNFEAANLTLTSNVVTAAVQEASLRAQISAMKEIIEADRKQLDAMKQQLALGGISNVPVMTQTAALAQNEATLPALEKQLSQVRHQLGALVGQFPSEDLSAKFDLAQIKLPEELPVSLPSKLVEQRPDIKAAESLMRAANAKIGVATANMLPQITLSAGSGSAAQAFGDLFTGGAGLWSLGAGITQPIFQGGALMHKRGAAQADYEKVAAMYKGTVIAAFQNVADVLKALQSDAETLKAQADSERAARESLNMAQSQFEAGAISYLSLLTANKAYQQARMSLVKAQAARYADTAALFQALGGGWWNKNND